MAYTWRTTWPGVLAQHADRCPARDGGSCACGPLGYRANVEDPESGEPVLSPVLDTPDDARAWRHEQQDAFDAWRASSDARPSVRTVVEEFLAAAARGSARDRFGQRYDTEGLRVLRWALTGHVQEDLGTMAVAEVRARHVQALVDRLDAAGLSQRRVDAVVSSLRSLFAYAVERDLISSSPAESIALPDEDEEQFTAAPMPVAPPVFATGAVPSTAALPQAAVPPMVAGMVPEQIIWTCLKAVTLIFILIALVLVAESV